MEEKVLASMAYHRKHPEITLEEYRHQKFAELEASLSRQKLIYLDLKYWIYLRDPAGSSDANSIARLYDLLIKGVESGRILCPASATILSELQKQTNEKRKATAKIMDWLSLGVTMKAPHLVAEIELSRFFVSHCLPTSGQILHDESIWTKSGLVFGEKSLPKQVIPRLTEKGKVLFAKALFDALWNRRIEEMISHTIEPISLPDFYKDINNERKQKPRDERPFDELFAAQLYSAIDHRRGQLSSIIAKEFSEKPDEQQLEQLAEMVCRAVLRATDASVLPSLRVTAAIHADIRMDDSLPHQKGDLEDAFHAGCAVGYCAAFLTERTLANRLKSRRIQKWIPQGCRIVWEPKEAVLLVESLL